MRKWGHPLKGTSQVLNLWFLRAGVLLSNVIAAARPHLEGAPFGGGGSARAGQRALGIVREILTY
jgi:hypothetical protein